MDYSILDCEVTDTRYILESLVTYNNTQVSPEQRVSYKEINKKVVDKDGHIIAGCLAGLYFGCVLGVDILWVDASYRRQGLGAFLLREIEEAARQQSCTLIHLDTFDFQAKDFYLKQGYTVFGTLEGCPEGHSRYYLCKAL